METRASRKRKDTHKAGAQEIRSVKRVRRQQALEGNDKKQEKASPTHVGKSTPGSRTRTGAAQRVANKRQAQTQKEQQRVGNKDKRVEVQPSSGGKMDSASRRLKSEHDEEHHDDDQDDLAQKFGRTSGMPMPSTLQGLLHRLGAGLDAIPGSNSAASGRFKELVTLLQSDEEIQQLEALTQMCGLLSISTEDSLAAFPVEQTVPLLVNVLNVGQMPETLVLAARALSFLADVLPASCSTIVRHEGVPALCMHLLTIEYIDLAEQSLQVLFKVSNEHPQACLRNGALVAVLSFIDFFQTGVQRLAVATAANMCRGISAEHLEALQTAIPTLTNLLQFDDAKVVDNACLALTRIADAFSEQPQHLKLLADGGVAAAALQLINAPESGNFSTQLSLSTYFGLIKFLATVSAGCASANELLLQSRVSRTLKTLLASSSFSGSFSSSSLGGSALSSSEQLYDVLSLVSILLPPVPDPMQHVLAVHKVNSLELPVSVPLSVGVLRGPERQLVARAEGAAQFIQANTELLQQFAEDLLPLLLQLYSSTALQQVRRKCLVAITKIVHFAPAAMLTVLLEQLPMSSFISTLLVSKDPTTVCFALVLATQLLQKLPDVFARHFVKEGVTHGLHQLAESHCAASESPAKPPQVPGDLTGSAGPSPKPCSAGADREAACAKDHKRRSSARLRKGKDAKEASGQAEGPSKGSHAEGPAGDPVGPSQGHIKAEPEAVVDAEPAVQPALSFPLSISNAWASVGHTAQLLEEHYFGAAEDRTLLETDGILLLRGLCDRLQEVSAWEELCSVLDAVGSTRVSTFEFLSSNTPERLADYLQGKDIVPYSTPQHMERLHRIGCVLLVRGSGNSPPMLQLLRKLHDCLAAVESLPVTGMGGGSACSSLLRYGAASGMLGHSSGGGSNDLSELSQPLKLRLCLAREAAGGLKDYGSSVVLVDPMASLGAVEDFLWPRVQPAAAPDAETAAGKAAGGSTSKAADEQRGGKQRGKGKGKGGKDKQAAEPKEVPRRMGLRGRLPGSKTDAGPSTSQPTPAVNAPTRGRRRGNRDGEEDANEAPGPAQESEKSTTEARINLGLRRMTRSLMRQLSMKEEGKAEEDRSAGQGPSQGASGVQAPSPRRSAYGDVEMEIADEGADDDSLAMEDAEDEYEEELLAREHAMLDHDEDMFEGDRDDEGESDDDDDAGADQEGALQRHASRVWSMNLEVEAAAAASEAAKVFAKAMSSRTGENGKKYTAADQTDGQTDSAGRFEARTYAQAAGSRGSADGPPPRLVFMVNGQAVNPSSTVFQAVQSYRRTDDAGEADEGGAGPGPGTTAGTSTDRLLDELRRRRRTWEVVFKLTYRPYNPETDAQLLTSPDASGATAPSASLQASVEPASGFERLQAASLPEELPVGQGGAAVLYLMRLLYALNQLMPRLAKAVEPVTVNRQAMERQRDGQGSALASFGAVLPEEFVNSKVSGKFSQQLKDVVPLCAGSLPRWCRQLTHEGFRFLMPFELRRHYFYCTAFGMVRALQYLEQTSAADRSARDGQRRDGRAGHRMPRLQRQKVRVSRKRVLESGQKLMELYASHKVILELEFSGEVGTGLGPTLEFYTILSHELQKVALGMWRNDGRAATSHAQLQAAQDGSHQKDSQRDGQGGVRGVREDMEGADQDPSQYVHSQLGLFPAPLSPQQLKSKDGARILSYFKLLGRMVAKAMQDFRLVDLPLNHAFLRRVTGTQLSLYDVRDIDEGLGSSLEKMEAAALAAEQAGSSQVLVDGVPVEDLCLSYEVPGYAGYPLAGAPAGAPDVGVTSQNVRQYVADVVDATVGHGIQAQVFAFVDAFNEVFDVGTLGAFSVSELEVLLCGTLEHWTVESLADVVKFDHGYTTQSSAAQYFLQTLAEMDAAEQRRFLRFVTGSPRLPPGGLGGLQPRLTVVRKHSSSGTGGGGEAGTSMGASGPSAPSPLRSSGSLAGMSVAADMDLPSVMTCANYIKLPAFSSKEVLKERLMFAINEGQGSFDLS